MNELKSRAWEAFSNIVSNFLDSKKASNYKDLVNELVESYHALGCNLSIKNHYVRNHLDRFPKNHDALSEEQGELFHQDIKVIEQRYQEEGTYI